MGGKSSLFKVVLLGLPKSGTTNVFNRLVGDGFSSGEETTTEQPTRAVFSKIGTVKQEIQSVEPTNEYRVKYYDFNRASQLSDRIYQGCLTEAKVVLFCMTPTQLRAFSSFKHTHSGMSHQAEYEKRDECDDAKKRIDTETKDEKTEIEEQAKKSKAEMETLLQQLSSRVKEGIKLMFVITKNDISTEKDILSGVDAGNGFDFLIKYISGEKKKLQAMSEYVEVSAKDKSGIEGLKSTIATELRANELINQHDSSQRSQVKWKPIAGGLAFLMGSGGLGLWWAAGSGTLASAAAIGTTVFTVLTATAVGLTAFWGVALLLVALYLSYKQENHESTAKDQVTLLSPQ
ncbi:MAG: hypothetical protein GKR77_01390 [Legionellales bacterium]|nr:hypothetical protein [Legionellales bacterium]